MTNSRQIFNWSQEAETVRSFLTGDKSVLHVFSGRASHPHHFLNMVERVAMDVWNGEHGVCRVDHLAMPTSTPVAVLSHIAQTLGLPLAKQENGGSSTGNFMSDLRSFRDINITGNQVTVAYGADVELLTYWLRTYYRAAQTDLDLRKKVVMVHACEVLTSDEKRSFGRNVWESALCPLLPTGLKLVFAFNPDQTEGIDAPWPPPRDSILQLPSYFKATNDLVDQIGEWLVANGHASTVAGARESAEILIATSPTVSDLYTRLAFLEMSFHAGGTRE